MAKNSKTVSLNGPPCPRCSRPTEIREHERITEQELARPFYYSRWYICPNQDCKTTTVMPDEFKVCSENQAQRLDGVMTPPADHREKVKPQVRYLPPDNPPAVPVKSNAIFVKSGFRASLCLECAHVDLIPANEDHKPCTVCGAEPTLT